MYSLASPFITPETFHQEFYDTLTALIEQILAADTDTIFSWLQTGYVIFTTVCFGIFPLVSLLLVAITLLVLPILCYGRGRKRMQRILGIGDMALTLVAIQPLPVIGPLGLPLLYAIFHGVYDTVLRRRFSTQDPLPMMA